LVEEETSSTGGPLRIKIGGVKNRRGNAPYAVKFKALIKGGSGRIKSVTWSFGDGESASDKEAQHMFTQGVYVVIVSVEDDNGQKATAQINISVEENCGC
jgi:PKD repeat protein